MFCGLLGGNFSKKCKQAVKLIKMRIEHIKRKKQVIVFILKKDIADLIACGRKANAFKRVDALIVEMNLASCYEMVEGFCDCIMNQLPILQKTKDCPEEAMEAVSTLIFAAARFPDLPELRDLRSLFAERYGNCMESSVNPQFAEKTRNKTFSKQTKLELMKDIAAEFDRPNQEEISDCNLTRVNVELDPKEIHVISTIKGNSDNEEVAGESHEEEEEEEEEELNKKNRRGRYSNPPYHIQPTPPLSSDHVATKDEEEMALDRKGTDTTEPTELDDGAGEVKKAPPPQRSFSLPHESDSTPSEAKTHVRGKSLQSDPVSPKRGRVHRRLPDYDQLAATFAALKNGGGAAAIPHTNLFI